ncbi:membrane lipoprotein lipid attachment site [Anaeromyxobacter sp. K]|uniref:penicillin-binding protein activator LpoB n=1 Tax=Anaeromyxobacter sp. (strain K) TaxID=447217 RepID=UPI00015F892E|nr:penicillin-binding protein activator LpoB [Anaeromyxobacter sp. K]ACG73041.1 membrane lipoprotein lipid attachment site [Anaeromyxobacter sp. K]
MTRASPRAPSRTLPLLAAAALVAACGPRAFTRGAYEDPNTIELLSDQFNENDLQLIARKMTGSLLGAPAVQGLPGRPVLVVGRVRNKTSEHIDTESLADKVRVELQRSGRFAFADAAAREQIAAEYDYQQSGMVAKETAKGPGAQVGADYVLTGQIASIVQEVGADKVVYYKMTMQLTDLRTGLITWTDEKELRKKFRKQSVGW